MPLEDLRAMAPTIVPNVRISVRDDRVTIGGTEARPAIVYPIDSIQTRIFNLMNGDTTIGEACQTLVSTLDCAEEHAFDAVCQVFFALIEHRLCVPR